MKFLRENWLWFVLPIVFVTVAAVVAVKLLDDGGDGAFTYPM